MSDLATGWPHDHGLTNVGAMVKNYLITLDKKNTGNEDSFGPTKYIWRNVMQFKPIVTELNLFGLIGTHLAQ